MRASLFLTTGLAAVLAACGGSDSGPSVTCGTGTTLMDDVCVATGGSNAGSGTGDTCGAGTHLDGTTCLPDDTTVQAAPTATSIDPPAAGITGSVLFTITGTGFAGSNVTDLHVYFGDPTNPDCNGEATIGTATATTIAGEVPGACSLSPSATVTIQTNLGTTTLPFNYLMLFAADGDGGGQYGAGGDIYVIDPFAQLSLDLGGPTDADNNQYGYAGLDFDATGTLYAVTTGFSPADLDGVSQLVLIDLSTGTFTIKGDAVDASQTRYYITDIKFANGTLYGWGYWDDGTDFEHTLVTIDTVTGAVTPVGASTVDDTVTGGLAVDAAGNLLAAVNGAGADANSAVPTTGELDTVNTTDGTLTSTATLDWPIGAPIQAMTTFTAGTNSFLLGIVDDGWYGAANADQLQQPIVGETLALIDPTATGGDPIVGALFELPAKIGSSTHVDALAVPPASLVLARHLPKTGWTHLAAGTRAVR
jgi:hypothetical protein